MLKTFQVKRPLRTYRAITENPIPFLTEVFSESGDFVRVQAWGFESYLVNDPDLYREALVEKSDVFVLQGGAAAGLGRLIGDGILTNRGDNWRQSRRTLQPLFNQSALDTYPETIEARFKESLQCWKTDFADKPFSLNREILSLCVRVTCSSLFNYLPDFNEARRFADAIWVLQQEGMIRYAKGLDLLEWLPVPLNLKVGKAKRVLAQVAKNAIAAGANFPEDEILSILFAGTESPANTICWAMKVLQEHLSLYGELKGQSSDLLLEKLLSETLRLYPAGWAFERFSVADTTLGGVPIKKGARFFFSPYLLHRNPRFWSEPEKFDPQRFSAREKPQGGVPKYAYLPFGAGPRSCIGSRMAWIEMELIMRELIKNCEWKSVSEAQDNPYEAQGSFKLRFNRPIFVQMKFLT